uniref:Ubiquitin-like protease family profile domain-containing protein n=1 Tax=Setaria italica TaxID=4555 RepID=K3Z308_SETIT
MGVDRKVKCSLKAVAQAVGFLGDEATRILKDDLKFHNMMGLDLDSLKRRDIVEIIYNRTEVVDGTIVTHISNEQRIVVTVKRIEEILGLPCGIEGEEVILPKSAHKQVLDLFLQYPDTLNKDVPSKPNFKNSLIGAKNLINLMKKVPDSKDKVRCFLMVLLNRVLIPASGFHLNERQAALAWDLECVAKTDWCKVVFDDLSDCIVNKHRDTNFSGCSLVLLELNEENVNNAKQIFVPVNAERVHWILVVMDFDKHKVQILDSFASETYLVPAYKVASQLELYLMTKFNLHTGYPKERDLKLEKQKNINDCGFHVLLYIQRYGRSDMYKIDTEQILCYRKQLAYELKRESNDHPSTSTLNLDDSPLHVYSARPPPGRSTTSPSVSGSLSATESDPLGAKKQSAEEEGTSSNRLVPNEKEEGAAAHTKRKRRRTDKAVGTPVVSQRPDTGAAAQELCNLLLKADPNSESNLISFPSLKMTIKEGVTFLRDGSATIEMLRETIKIIGCFEAKNPNRYKIIVGPMDMSTLDDTGSEAFKDAVKTQMVVPSIPQYCKMVFLPVKKGSNWLVYCINGVCKRIDYLICSSNEEPMAATELCKPLLKEVDFHGRKIFGFMDWSSAVVPLEKKISSSDTGLLAMYFMEKPGQKATGNLFSICSSVSM